MPSKLWLPHGVNEQWWQDVKMNIDGRHRLHGSAAGQNGRELCSRDAVMLAWVCASAQDRGDKMQVIWAAEGLRRIGMPPCAEQEYSFRTVKLSMNPVAA
jgi:hypothetical protein